MSTLLIAGPERAVAVSSAVEGFRDFGCDLVSAPAIAAALAFAQEKQFHAVVLSFADTNELTQSVKAARRAVPESAILALLDVPDPLQVQNLIRAGADDVAPAQASSRSLELAFAAALQRSAFGPSELDYLVRLARGSRTTVTSTLFGSTPLREAQPALFDALVARYSELFDSMLDALSFRTEIDLKEQLRAIAHRLGELNAGPRDVIEMHTAALGQKMRSVNPARVRAYVDEGKMLVLELMGYLVAFYRSHAIGLRRRPGAQSEADGPR